MNKQYGGCYVEDENENETEIHPEQESIFAEYQVDFVFEINQENGTGIWYFDSEEIDGEIDEDDIFQAVSLEEALKDAVKMLLSYIAIVDGKISRTGC